MLCRNNNSAAAVVYNPNVQTLNANDFVTFNSIANLTGCGINFNAGTTPAILKEGVYLVIIDANLVGTAAGPVSLQLLNNNTAVQNAVATFTAAAGTEYNASISTVIKVLPSCCCNKNIANLQLQVLNTGVELTNVTMTIVKL